MEQTLERDEARDAEAPTADTDTDTVANAALVDDELLVEEISIDGMCGVY